MTTTTEAGLYRLLAWLSPGFPVGAFSYSHALEAAVEAGTVRDRASLERAMDKVTTVVSAVHGFAGPGHVTPASIDRDGNVNLVDSATAAGADVVLMSVVGVSADSPMELFRAKHDAEEHLRASGASWTIVRSSWLLEP